MLLCPTIISPRVSASWRSNRRRRTTLRDRCPQRRPPPAAPARDPPSRPPLLHQPSVAAAAVDRAPAVRQGDRTSADPGCFQPEGDRARLARRQRVALWSAVPLRLRWPRALYEARTHTRSMLSRSVRSAATPRDRPVCHGKCRAGRIANTISLLLFFVWATLNAWKTARTFHRYHTHHPAAANASYVQFGFLCVSQACLGK